MIRDLQMKKWKYPGCYRGCLCRTLLLTVVMFGLADLLMAQEVKEAMLTLGEPHRVKDSVFGKADAFSGDQLRIYHPTDLLKALQVAEPALNIPDEGQFVGSNPNHVPQSIEIRGVRGFRNGASAGNALPLILVDGYEISVERLFDFDINRVKEVRVLKDASASALYGVKAGNGVIVITTLAPRTGKIRLTYRFDGGIEKADLSSFDLLDAGEKLELEKKAGMYSGQEALYKQRVGQLEKEGETNWLKLPLQTSFLHRHRLSVEGGDRNVSYRAYLMAAPGTEGVMKGAKRDLYNAGTQFFYTSGNVRVSDELKLDLNNARHSPYGVLAGYMQVNPYFRKENGLGWPIQKLGEGTLNEQASPYYEALLSSFSKQKMTRILNSLNVSWDIVEGLRLAGNFTFTKDFNKYEQYVSPNSSTFLGLSVDQTELKGSYQIVRDNTTVYEEKLVLDYFRQAGGHAWKVGMGLQAYSSAVYSDNYTGVGIASDPMDYISFAKRYAFESKPGGSKYYEHLLGGFVYGSYDYARRYVADFSARVDKSSLLAPEKRVAPSWALNATWNIHNEGFLKEFTLLSRLALHVGGGMNAGYQFGYADVNPMYGYALDNPYINTTSTSSDWTLGLATLGQVNVFNRSLKWRNDRNLNVDLDVELFRCLKLSIGYYNTLSDDLATVCATDAVTGGIQKLANAGSVRNSGWEFSFNALLLNVKNKLQLNVLASGMANKNELRRLPDYFMQQYNRTYFGAGSGNQVVNGQAADGIYAVRSVKIDPADGKEIFLDREGKETKAPAVADLVYMGSAAPKLNGNFGFSAACQNWQFSCMFGYRWGGKYYDYGKYLYVDQARIEDNGPKELQEKWWKAGDVAAYPGTVNASGLLSSRLVETYNALSLKSVYIGYRFSQALIRHWCMEDLQVGLSGHDLFYRSSVKTERGLFYPFARSFNLSLQVTF